MAKNFTSLLSSFADFSSKNCFSVWRILFLTFLSSVLDDAFFFNSGRTFRVRYPSILKIWGSSSFPILNVQQTTWSLLGLNASFFTSSGLTKECLPSHRSYFAISSSHSLFPRSMHQCEFVRRGNALFLQRYRQVLILLLRLL